MLTIAKNKLPRHVAIIMDGNGRWARRKLLTRINGHRKGIEPVRDTTKYCRELGIEYLTLYTFSKENWNRPTQEVQILMGILDANLKSEESLFIENNIRFKAIGAIKDLPEHLRVTIAELEAKTAHYNGMTLQVALSYSGREEILHAVRTLAGRVGSGVMRPEDIDEKAFQSCLYTSDAPDPDLLIRTSGEMRISNFLLWQIAYTEIYVTDVFWPDFTRRDFDAALAEYGKRDRRYGLVKEEEDDEKVLIR